jgi:hypothetical protein
MKLTELNDQLKDVVEGIIENTPELEEMVQGARPSTKSAAPAKAPTPPQSSGKSGSVKPGGKKVQRYGTAPQNAGRGELTRSRLIGIGRNEYSTPPQSGSAQKFEDVED